MQNILKVTLPDAMAKEVSKKAKESNLSKAAYVRRLIEEDIDGNNSTASAPMKDIRLRLSDKKAERLSEIAGEYNMPVKEYLIRVASHDMPPRIHVVVQDIYYVSMELNDLENSIAGVCASIRRTGKTYEQDVQMIIKTLQDIENLFHNYLTLELDARNRLYKEAKDKLFTKVKETRAGTLEEWVY